MKSSDWLTKLIHFKFTVAMYFGAAILLSSIISYFYGLRAFSFATLWEILGLSIVGSGLHYLYRLKWPIVLSTAVHLIFTYGMVCLASVLFGWNFLSSTSVFWQFTGIFILVYIFVYSAWSVYYWIENNRMNQKLDEYKKNLK